MRWLIKIAFFIFIYILYIGCGEKENTQGKISHFIPEGATLTLKVSDVKSFISEVQQNTFLSSLPNNDFIKIITEKEAVFQHFSPKKPVLLCFKKGGGSTIDYVFITRKDSSFVINDSIADLIAPKVFTANKNGVFLAGSKRLIEEILIDKVEKDPEFLRMLQVKKNNEVISIYRGLNHATDLKTSLTSIDLSTLPNGITASGITLVDSLQLLHAFKGQTPQVNELQQVIPTNAKNAISFTFSDATTFIGNLKKYRNDSLYQITTPIFESTTEIGSIQLPESSAIALKSIAPDVTLEELSPMLSEKSVFREMAIFNFENHSLFSDTFRPLIDTDISFVFKWESFFIFTETEGGAQKFITALQNRDCIVNSSYFEGNNKQITQSSSILIYGMEANTVSLAQRILFNKDNHQAPSNKRFPFSAIQYTYERDFAHVNLVCLQASKKQANIGTVSLVFNTILENEILGIPQFFTNHRTKRKDIVVQDIANQLHLFSEEGKIIWKKQLNGPILGKVHEVDLLKNGKKQLAFATNNTFYILDRNGNAVTPFPKNFKGKITQPLSVFDYDKKRNYRFVITEGKKVSMYDRKGKKVKGFTFKKTKSDIVLPPKHIRIGAKDYIVIAEENGKLNVLSRIGKSRIKVNKTFDFSDIPIAYEGKKIVVIEKNNQKSSVDASGKITTKKIDPSVPYYFSNHGKLTVSMIDNLLSINSKSTELPFGIYSQPQIFIANRRFYISVTEVQENKIYAYNSLGELQSGFPVFGKSLIDLVAPKEGETPLLVVLGNKNEFLVYTL